MILRTGSVVLGKGADDGGSPLIERGFAGLAAGESHEDFVVRGGTVGLLNAGIPESGPVDRRANAVGVGSGSKLDADDGAAAEVNV